MKYDTAKDSLIITVISQVASVTNCRPTVLVTNLPPRFYSRPVPTLYLSRRTTTGTELTGRLREVGKNRGRSQNKTV